MGSAELLPRHFQEEPWHLGQVRAPTGPSWKLGAGHTAGRWSRGVPVADAD